MRNFLSDVSVVLMFRRNVPVEWYKSARFPNSDQNDAYEKVGKKTVFFWLMVEWKLIVRAYFFENNLFLQSNVVFDSESNGGNLSSLVQPVREKKNIFYLLRKMTLQIFFSPLGGARELE